MRHGGQFWNMLITSVRGDDSAVFEQSILAKVKGDADEARLIFPTDRDKIRANYSFIHSPQDLFLHFSRLMYAERDEIA